MSKLMKCIVKNIEKYAADAVFVAAKSYEADVKFRVHNQGRKSDGSSIGNYSSKPWIKTRQAEGKQIGYVDLQYTGQFRDSLTTGQIKGGAALGFTTDLSKDIKEGQEDHFGTIYRPTTIELRDMEDRFNDELMTKIKKCKR